MRSPVSKKPIRIKQFKEKTTYDVSKKKRPKLTRCITAPATPAYQKAHPKQGTEIDGYYHYAEGIRKLRELRQQKKKQAAAAECVKDWMKKATRDGRN